MKKFLFSKISLCLIAGLVCIGCKNVYSQKLSADSGGRKLQVELRMPEAWQRIVIGPKTAMEYPKVPRKFSMFMTGESTGALKPYLIIEDGKGAEYRILLAMTTGKYVGGKDLAIALADADKTSHNVPDAFPLNNVKPPVKLKGIFFWCRKPLPDTTLYIGNLRFDDTVVEDFSSDNGWQVTSKKGKGSRSSVSLFAGAMPGRAMEGFIIPEPFPEREGSLTSNTSFEKDEDKDGMPDGWFPANRKELLPSYQFGEPMVDLDDYKGSIAWENIGAESPRSASISVEGAKKWAAVGTVLKDIKPHTDYTVLCNHP